MKKIFFLAAAMLAAVTINAQDFRNITAETDYKITGAVKNSESDAKKMIYDMEAIGTEVLFAYGDVEASITNTTEVKSKIFTVALGKYIEFGGKNGVLHIYETSAGSDVTLRCACKSDKGAAILTVVEGAEEKEVSLPARNKQAADADKDGYIWVDATFKANASEVILKETMYGFRIESITVSGGTGISNTTLAPKAQKIMENGQLVIVRDGVKYNALGAVID